VKKITLVATLLLSSMAGYLFLSPSAQAAERVLIKFATLAPEGSVWMKTMREIDKTIREKSQGQITFRLYPGGVAGDELDVLKKIRIGQIHSAAFSGVGFGEILPMVRVLDLPFLFRDYGEIDRVHRELEGYFRDRFREKGFELLSWAEVGNVHLFSQEPIRRIGDVARLKVWCWSGDPIAKETFTQMGTSPIPLSIADVITSLSTGMIDTVYAPPLGAIALQWHRYVKFMTSLPLAHSTGAVLMSAPLFQKIPETHSRMIREEFREAMVRLTKELREQSEEAVRVIEKAGITVIPMPTGTDLQDFFRIHDEVAHNLAGKIYPKELLDRVYAILKRHP
jgi:TRAP-type C4-dicarboxylate transport system substrate-binding protein